MGFMNLSLPPATRLIIICGLPGSGKTTLAKQLENFLDALRLCPDEWMNDLSIDLYDEARRAQIEAIQWQLGQRLLLRGISVIVEWGTWGRSERDELRVRAREIGVAVELHYLHESPNELFRRIQARNMEIPPITENQILNWCRDFQVPDAEELALFDPKTLIPGEGNLEDPLESVKTLVDQT